MAMSEARVREIVVEVAAAQYQEIENKIGMTLNLQIERANTLATELKGNEEQIKQAVVQAHTRVDDTVRMLKHTIEEARK